MFQPSTDKGEFMKIVNWLGAAAIILGSMLSMGAHAIPLVYICTLTDYNTIGATKVEFQFIVGNGVKSFRSAKSEARLYLNEHHTLSISLRQISNPDIYASVTGYNLPMRISVILAGASASTVAARLDCQL